MKISEQTVVHTPFAWIGGEERVRALTMDQAMRETGVDEALRTRLLQSFFETADWMRNREI